MLDSVINWFGCACAPLSSVDFTFDPAAPLEDETITFSGSAVSETPVTYAWNFADGSTGAGPTATHAYTAGGSYDVVLTASNACSSGTATHTVAVTEVCDFITGLDFTWLPASPLSGEAVTFTAAVTGGDGPITYTWDFADGGTGAGISAEHTYTAGGDYLVSLTAVNACTNLTITDTVAIRSIYDIFLPVIVK